MTAIEQKVKDLISASNLMDTDGKYIATLSGGPDSVALLVILVRLGYKVEACHCNFHLRGREADRDEMFCRNLCRDMGIKLHVVNFDTYAYASLHKVSIEMAARELRYDYFERLRRDIAADGICVAHHINDTVETVLMNLIRGTGIRGLKGISLRNGYILRPMLGVTRKEIEEFLDNENIKSVTDSSNLVNDVTRNRIRLDIIPLMEQINPSAVNNMARTAHRVDEALKVFDDAMKRAVDGVRTAEGGYSIERLLATPSPEYTLFTILEDYGFTPAQTEDIYANISAPTGTVYRSATHCLLIDRGSMIIKSCDGDSNDDEINIDGTEGTWRLNDNVSFVITQHPYTKDYKIKRDRCTAALDAAKLTFPLTVRKVRTGDRFVPFGMKGSKLLSDYMTDRKFSLFSKQRQNVVTDAHGNIVWVVNERPDARYCITEDTERIIEIKTI